MKYKSKTLLYFFAIVTFVFADGLYGYGFTNFMYSRGLSVGLIGTLLGITDICIMVFDYPSGNFADKYGRKKICGLGYIFYGIGFLFFASSSNFYFFVTSCVIIAFGSALISGAINAWYIGELAKNNDLGYKDTIFPYVRGIGLLIGSISGLAAAKISQINLATPFYTGGIILIISGLVILICLADNYSEKEKQTGIIRLTIKNTKSFIKDKNMKVLTAISVLKIIPFSIFIISWQIYMTQVIGLNESYLGIFYTLMLILMSLSSFLTGLIIKKLKGYNVTIIGEIICAISFVLLIINNPVCFTVSFILFEFGIGLINSSYYTWLYDFIPVDVASSYQSALSAIESLSSFFISTAIGWIITFSDFTFAFVIGALISLLTIIPLSLMKTKKRSE